MADFTIKLLLETPEVSYMLETLIFPEGHKLI
jgi:hypothetical protein